MEKAAGWSNQQGVQRPLDMQRHVWENLRLRPKVVYWIHTMVVSPTVTYAVPVWWPRVNFKRSRVELIKLGRMTCLGITAAMRTAQMPPFGRLPPLHLQLEVEASAGIYRLHCSDEWEHKCDFHRHSCMTQDIL
jgi:hypothetical protein